MKPIKGKYLDNDGHEVHGTILAFLNGYREPTVGVFMPDVTKGDFTQLKLIRIEELYAQKT